VKQSDITTSGLEDKIEELEYLYKDKEIILGK
jgi:hypothetical protein